MFGYAAELSDEQQPPSPTEPFVRDSAFTLTLSSCQSLRDYGLLVLNTHETSEKAEITYKAYTAFNRQSLPITSAASPPCSRLPPPVRPARPLELQTLPMHRVAQVVKGDTAGNRLRMLHALAHIESYAIDLAWDILVRWMDGISTADVRRDIAAVTDSRLPAVSSSPQAGSAQAGVDELIFLPRDFYSDWLRVACEESRHFTCWANRLQELGSRYSAFPVHDGLWQSASDTAGSLLARLSIVHCTHEAHGLDASLRMAKQLESSHDLKSQQLLLYIERDEQTHVQAGLRWLRWTMQQAAGLEREDDCIAVYQGMVRRYFRGRLKGPFNVEARRQCGMGERWYQPLLTEDERQQTERREREARQQQEERRRRKEATINRQRQEGLQQQQNIEKQRREQQAAAPSPANETLA